MFCLYDTKMIILPVTDLKPTTGCTQDIDGGWKREAESSTEMCCSNLICNTRKKHDVPESKQRFTLMSPVIIQ